MNDVEHDLRELLDRKAGSVGTVAPRLPDAVRKRGRRRQLATTAMGTVAAVAIGVVSLAGLRAIDRAQPDGAVPIDDPWAGYTVFERTATVGTFTITSPSDTYLIRPGGGFLCGDATDDCSVLQLTDFDPGLDEPACGRPLPADGVALVVNYVPGERLDGFPEWPATAEVTDSQDPWAGLGPCGEGRYLRFSEGGNSVPYVAWIGRGPDATDRQVQTILRSFQGMSIEPTGLMATGPAAYVIAGGENAAGPWRLELRPSRSDEPTANVELSIVSPEGGAGAGDFTVPGGALIEQAGGDPVFGAVTKDAVGVELRLEEGTPTIPAQLVPLPPSMPFGFDLFFASNDADVQATAVAVGADGEELATGEAPLPSISGTPEPTPDERRRVAEGATGGTGWALEYEEGRELALVGASDDILFDRIAFNHMASLSAENPMLIGVHDFGTADQALFLLYGVSHPDVDRIVITLVDGQVIELGRGTMRDPSIHIYGRNPNVSPGVWWVQMPPGPVIANVTAFDAACQRLGRAGLALYPGDQAEEILPKAECPTLGG